MKLGWKIWLLIIVLIFSIISIFGLPPKFLEKGVVITSIDQNSTLFEQGLRKGQIITEIDGIKIESLDDFTNTLKGKYSGNESVSLAIKTKDSEYFLLSNQPPVITVSELSKTNIKTGLDLSGGSRALIKAKDK